MRRQVSAGTLVLFAALTAAARAQDPAGDELALSVFSTNPQTFPSAAVDGNSEFAVVWESPQFDGSGHAIVGRRFTWSGVPKQPYNQGLRINYYPDGDGRRPVVATDLVGNFIVAWEGRQPDGSYGIYARSVTHEGIFARGPFVPEFAVNTYTTGAQTRPAVAMNPARRFVIVWESDQGDGSGSGIFGRLHDDWRGPVGPDFQMNVYATGDQGHPGVGMDAAGNMLVVWHSQGEDGSARGIVARRFDRDANPAAPFVVNTSTAGDQMHPAVAMNASGAFVAVWETEGTDGSSTGIVARKFDALDVPLGPEFQVNAYTTGAQFRPTVVMDTLGNFVVAWASQSQDGSGDGLFARRYDASGTPREDEFALNTYTTGSQFPPMLAGNGDGDLVAVWHSARDGSPEAIVGQRYGAPIFQDGFETGRLSRWSRWANLDLYANVKPFVGLGSTALALQAEAGRGRASYVQDDTPAAEDRYRCRFYFDPNSLDPDEENGHRRVRLFIALSEPMERLLTVVLRRDAGAFALMGRVRRDDGARVETGFFAISDAPHMVELDWRRSSAPGADDGQLAMWIDETLVSTLAGIDNDAGAVELARMGLLTLKPGARGHSYFDQFESRRQRYIGPEWP